MVISTMPSPFFGLILLLSGGAVAFWSHRIVRLYHLAQAWPKARAVILKSTVRVATDPDGTSYVPEFAYLYSINDAEYQSTVHSNGLALQHDPENSSRQLIEAFPVGAVVEVAVDPNNPASAVLDTGFPEYWLAIHRRCICIAPLEFLSCSMRDFDLTPNPSIKRDVQCL